jgi:tRNA 2-selenouridine synthase
MVAPLKRSSDWQGDYEAIIDVRTPAEFADDHIPGAINLPVLSDDERVKVGTLHKQNAFEGRRLGAALISRNIADHLDRVLADKPPSWSPLIYCWRGGQRSGSLARVMAETGWVVTVLDGGYKTYRGHILDHLNPLAERLKPVLIQGPTGSAKTHILNAAKNEGIQCLDLEGLAVHRGSLLGFEPNQDQPSPRMFDSLIFDHLSQFDLDKPVLIEAESSKIGACQIPKGLWQIMQQAPKITISASLESRVEFLIRDYAHVIAEPERLDRLIDGMIKRHGHDVTQQWRDYVTHQNWAELVAALITEHYDPAYRQSASRKGGDVIGTLTTDRLDEAAIDSLAKDLAGLMTKI